MRSSHGRSASSSGPRSSVVRVTILAAPVTAGTTDEPALAYLLTVLARREARTIGLALRALVVLGVPEAGGVIRRCLDSDDPEIRAQAIEALDSIGDRELPQALVRLLEGEEIDVRDRDAALARLSDDDDPWINGLARRVRAGAKAMPDTSRTLGDLETMMLLRRVPLFDGLEPEDLQRIAMTSVERIYPAERPSSARATSATTDRHRRGFGPGRPRRA